MERYAIHALEREDTIIENKNTRIYTPHDWEETLRRKNVAEIPNRGDDLLDVLDRQAEKIQTERIDRNPND